MKKRYNLLSGSNPVPPAKVPRRYTYLKSPANMNRKYTYSCRGNDIHCRPLHRIKAYHAIMFMHWQIFSKGSSMTGYWLRGYTGRAYMMVKYPYDHHHVDDIELFKKLVYQPSNTKKATLTYGHT